MDRIELRRKNLVRPEAMPYRNAVGMIYDSGTLRGQHGSCDADRRLERFRSPPQERHRARQAARARALELRRIFDRFAQGAAEITVTPAGRVRVVIGTQPSGQGHETSFAQVVCSLLSVPVEAIDIIVGDTDVVSVGGGSHSGRSMRHAATAFSMAARELIEKGKKIAAYMLEASAAEIRFADGRFSAPHALRCYGFLELARDSAEALLPKELSGGLAVVADNEMHDPVFPNGCAI